MPAVATVYGVLGNDPAWLQALGDAVHQAPYKAAPRAPVLYIKPRNTHAASGAVVESPAQGLALRVTVGLLMGSSARRVRADQAMHHVAGCLLVADLAVPHTDFYRPSVRLIARDASCILGSPAPLIALGTGGPSAIELSVSVDDVVVSRFSLSGMLRSPPVLVADVCEFMTLQRGDVLLLGLRHPAPMVHPGSRFRAEGGPLGFIEGRLLSDARLALPKAGVGA